LYAFFISPVCSSCTGHRIFPDLITLITLDEAHKLWSSSLCSLLQSPATSSPLGPNILLSILFSYTLNLCPSLSVTAAEIIIIIIIRIIIIIIIIIIAGLRAGWSGFYGSVPGRG
jgi:hypothetical protein